MDEYTGEDRRLIPRCDGPGCPNIKHICEKVKIHRDNIKDHIHGCEEALNKRIDDMDQFHSNRWKALGILLITAITILGGLYAWADDKKSVQREKITVLEGHALETKEHRVEQHEINTELLRTMKSINDFMVRTNTQMKMLHPELQ